MNPFSQCDQDEGVGVNIEVGDLSRQHLIKIMRKGTMDIVIFKSNLQGDTRNGVYVTFEGQDRQKFLIEVRILPRDEFHSLPTQGTADGGCHKRRVFFIVGFQV